MSLFIRNIKSSFLSGKQGLDKKAAIIIIIILLLLLSSTAVILYRSKTAKTGKYAEIYQDQKLIRVIDLTQEKEPYTITIEGEDGAYNVLEIRDGSIGVADASCPDKICKNMGFLSDTTLPITCLPNHLVIQIRDGGQTDERLDGVAY